MTLILSGTNGVSDVDGTAATPAIRGSDTNTGIFFPAADTIAFAEGGTEVARFDSAGNLGIGTSSPATKLVAFQGSAQSPSSSGNMNTGFMFGQGSTDPMLNFGTDADGVWYNAAFANNAGVARVHRWLTGGSERARIDSSGNLLVGTTSVGGTGLSLYGNGGGAGGSISLTNTTTNVGQELFILDNRVAGTHTTTALQFRRNSVAVGAITFNGTSTAYGSGSDYRLKENIAPMVGALEKVTALKPCTYTWKSTGEAGEGFIAHELQEVCPSAVTGEKDAVNAEGKPIYQGVDTSFLVATLTAAIQEQQAIIEQLKADVAALKGAA